jgi:hypothetical protein
MRLFYFQGEYIDLIFPQCTLENNGCRTGRYPAHSFSLLFHATGLLRLLSSCERTYCIATHKDFQQRELS